MSAAVDAVPSLKRRLILDAAADMFIDHGYGAVSMDTIAREAGVSKATLYSHFASKDRLFATIIEDACRSNILEPGLLPNPAVPVRAALEESALRLLRLMLEPRSLAIHRVVVTEGVRFPELARAFLDNGPVRLRACLADWLAARDLDGGLRVPDPAVAADQFVSLIRGGLYTRASLGIPPHPSEVESTAREAAATFLRAFAPTCPGSAPSDSAAP